MMRAEHDVPIEQRYLWVEGHLSSRARKAVRKGLPKGVWPNRRVCFVGYAYSDLALPKEFDTLFRMERGEGGFRKHFATAVDSWVVIVAATQQFAAAWHELPHGWKTVCVIEFPAGVPAMIDELPTVDGWHESRQSVVLCGGETLQAMQQGHVEA